MRCLLTRIQPVIVVIIIRNEYSVFSLDLCVFVGRKWKSAEKKSKLNSDSSVDLKAAKLARSFIFRVKYENHFTT